jgi:hypothetical protein
MMFSPAAAPDAFEGADDEVGRFAPISFVTFSYFLFLIVVVHH